MATKPEALNTKSEDGRPIWPAARIIDGYVYELESTHPTMADAEARVDAVREAGDAAQAFTSGRPKFAPAGTVKGQPAYFAHAAAVYRVPAGMLGTIEGNEVTWTERPPRAPPANSKKAAKEAAKAPAKSVVTSKAGARIAARPKKAAAAEAVDDDEDE